MFAKVFAQIFDSSIAEDYKVRLVFEDMLKLADVDGVVDMTPEAISRRTNVPLEIVKAGIAALEQPDTRSRSSEHEGRRIARLDEHRDWGWVIVNYDKYRQMRDETDRKSYRAEWMRNKRREQREQNVNTHEQAVDAVNACEPMQKKKEKKKEVHTPPVREPEGQIIGEVFTLEQVIAKSQEPVQDHLRPAVDFVKYVYGIWEEQGGKNGNNIPVNIHVYVKNRWRNEGDQWQKGCHHSQKKNQPPGGGYNRPQGKTEYEKSLERLTAEARLVAAIPLLPDGPKPVAMKKIT